MTAAEGEGKGYRGREATSSALGKPPLMKATGLLREPSCACARTLLCAAEGPPRLSLSLGPAPTCGVSGRPRCGAPRSQVVSHLLLCLEFQVCPHHPTPQGSSFADPLRVAVRTSGAETLRAAHAPDPAERRDQGSRHSSPQIESKARRASPLTSAVLSSSQTHFLPTRQSPAQTLPLCKRLLATPFCSGHSRLCLPLSLAQDTLYWDQRQLSGCVPYTQTVLRLLPLPVAPSTGLGVQWQLRQYLQTGCPRLAPGHLSQQALPGAS